MLAGIISIAKSIPAILAIIKLLKKAYDVWEDRKIEAHYEKKGRVRTRLLEKLKTATGEEKHEIIKKLSMLNAGADPSDVSKL